jgi:uncharacterized membrane protein YebE (DUF533 family)
MGFLDRLVGDMIERGSGYNARKMVRRVGGKNILLLGGALVGGALLEQKMRGSSSTSFSATSASGGTATTVPPRSSSVGSASPAPPPPPPTPGTPRSTAPPPPPPPNSEAQEAEEIPVELLFAIVRTMVAAALADGELSPDERSVIEERLGEAPFSPDQRERVRKELLLPATPGELAELVDGDDREVLMRFGLLVALAHEGVSEAERAWLERLAAALEIDAERVRTMEAEIFEGAGQHRRRRAETGEAP